MVLGYTLLATAIVGLFSPVVNALHNISIHLEGGENVLHWVLAFGTLAIAYLVKDDRRLTAITIAYGVVYIVVGLAGFFVGDNVAFWHVAVGDNLLHFALGAVTLGAGFMSRNATPGRIRARAA
jgi:hypothetical protein